MVAIPHNLRALAGAVASYIGPLAESFNCGFGGCDVSSASIPLPSGQTVLTAPPSNEPAHFIGVAFGVQNYTCSNTSTYTSIGAVAELFDISCLYGTDLFDTIQEPLFEAWSSLTDTVTIQEAIEVLPHIVASDLISSQHYFIHNAAGGLSPVWDFRATPRFHGVDNAIFVGKGRASLPSPVDPAVNIAWLDVEHVSGDIADEVFRINTLGGQPPTSCTFGSSPDISVKYTSQYWFFGGSLD